MSELFTWSATEVLAAFRQHALTPTEYLESLLARLEEVGPSLNAVGDVYVDDARRAAASATQRYAGSGAAPRALEGLPVVVKDESEVAGRRTTNGSLLYQDYVAHENDPIVERLLAAGAIVLGRGLTPEFSIAFWTHSRLWGATRNPWNLDYDVSGSSGGSAASVAAGIVPLATGSDIGGSIRAPASVNGVVGYFPPSGRIPVAGVWGRDEWSRVGPLARTVADCALFVDVVAGPHVRDHMSLPPLPPIGTPDPDVRGTRVALSLDLGDWPVTEEVRRAVVDVADALGSAGASVETVDLTIERDLVRKASNCHNASLFAGSLTLEVTGHEDQLTPYTRAWLAEVNGELSATSFYEGRVADAEICRRVDDCLSTYDVLLTPAMCFPAFEAGVDHTQVPFVLDGVERDVWHDLHLTEVFNPVSRCPVVCVPAGRSQSGVPIGVQVVGRHLDERTPFAVAAAIEQHRPWPTVAPVTDG